MLVIRETPMNEDLIYDISPPETPILRFVLNKAESTVFRYSGESEIVMAFFKKQHLKPKPIFEWIVDEFSPDGG